MAACHEILHITTEMSAKAKIVRLGQIVTELKKENEELQARAVPSTPPYQVVERRGKREDVVVHIKDCEKMAKAMVEETTHFG